jgi:hypothetical protein
MDLPVEVLTASVSVPDSGGSGTGPSPSFEIWEVVVGTQKNSNEGQR